MCGGLWMNRCRCLVGNVCKCTLCDMSACVIPQSVLVSKLIVCRHGRKDKDMAKADKKPVVIATGDTFQELELDINRFVAAGYGLYGNMVILPASGEYRQMLVLKGVDTQVIAAVPIE
jgi:hypothetical protein